MGTVVLGGQLAATIIAVVLVPVFFVVFQRLSDRFAKADAADTND